jgi:outer membrane protein assembly factor BamB
VFGDHLYLQNTVGTGATEQERLMCFHADTGKLLWEHRYNIFTSDVPAHRLAWASPAVDPASGNVIAISANGLLMAFSPAGKPVWERSLAEEVGMWTTHGGRMSSPIIDGNQVIVSGLTFSWGQYAGGAHRFMSFDKTNGQMLWISAPEGRPTDTIYANPFVATVNGTRMFFSGGSDGAMHALKVATGEPVWNWLVSKRGLNTAALVVGDDVIVSHSEENIISNEMGMLAAVPAASTGVLSDKGARWLVRGVQAGYASPVTDGERIYVLDNGGVLFAFDLKSGKEVWKEALGTIAKASPVLADGKLYIGTENTGDAGGKFYIVKPGPDKAEILDQDWLGTPQQSEQIIASPIVARGRVYVASMDALYAIGPKTAPCDGNTSASAARERCRRGGGGRRHGADGHTDGADPEARAIDRDDRARVRRKGQRRRESRRRDLDAREPEGHRGRRQVHRRCRRGRTSRAGQGGDRFDLRHRPHPRRPRSPVDVRLRGRSRRAAAGVGERDRQVRRTGPRRQQGAGQAGGERFRVRQALPAVHGQYRVQQLHHPVGRPRERAPAASTGGHRHRRPALRARPVREPPAAGAAAVAAGSAAHGQGRVRGEAGHVVRHEARSADARQRPGARACKVWPRGQPEPAEWTISRVDPIGSLKGAPGLYADVPSRVGGGSEIYFDNIKVFKNAGK